MITKTTNVTIASFSNRNKSQRAFDLLCAGTSIKDIIDIIGCASSTVYDVKKALKAGQTVSPRKSPGRPTVRARPRNLRRLIDAIRSRPSQSLREHAWRLQLPQTTVLRSAKLIGAKSRARQRRPLLTETPA